MGSFQEYLWEELEELLRDWYIAEKTNILENMNSKPKEESIRADVRLNNEYEQRKDRLKRLIDKIER